MARSETILAELEDYIECEVATVQEALIRSHGSRREMLKGFLTAMECVQQFIEDAEGND